MDKRDEILFDLMPESEKAYFSKREKQAKKLSIKDAQTGLADTLMTEFVNPEDGSVLTPKDIIDRKMIGFVMMNPSPQNGKALYELAGIAAPKQVDVTSDGKSVDALLASLAIKNNEEEATNG